LRLAPVADRTFTPAEANSALAEVRPVAERMVAVRARLAELEDEQKDVIRIVAGNGHGQAVGEARTPEFASLAAELQELVQRLIAFGLQVKDVETGLVDFPALRDGEEVLLCWRVGEPSVGFWHRYDDGFAGRRPIDWSGDE
jgi:hypothetical protein